METFSWNHNILLFLTGATNSGCQKKEPTTAMLFTQLLLKSWQEESHVALWSKGGSCLLMTMETK